MIMISSTVSDDVMKVNNPEPAEENGKLVWKTWIAHCGLQCTDTTYKLMICYYLQIQKFSRLQLSHPVRMMVLLQIVRLAAAPLKTGSCLRKSGWRLQPLLHESLRMQRC